MKNTLFILTVICLFLISATRNDIKQRSSKGLLDNMTMAHIAIVVKDIEKTSEAYSELLGMEVPWNIASSHESKPTKYHSELTDGEAKLAFIKLGNITIELIEPIGGPSTWQEFLEKEGEGVHHIGFWIKGMKEHVMIFENKGMKEVQSGGWDGGEYSYIDATSQLGIIVELLENYEGE